jgi:2,3-bisphosphoglycerate-independent phosphoglycerate mutase
MGKLGSAKLVPGRLEPSADTTLMNMLGYDADKAYTGRAPLEAANLKLELEENEIPFRMNFITEASGTLADPTAGRISTKEARALINFLNKKLASDFVRFFPGSEYRHIAVLKDAHGLEALSAKTATPEDVVGDTLESHFPKGPGEELLRKMMYDARLLLQDHEINQVRVDLKENPANMIWLWGQGPQPELPAFREAHGLRGALVAGAEYARGLALLAGLDVVDAPGATGDLETDYLSKGESLIKALEKHDLVCLHVAACDEASRRGDLKAKVSALEGIDYYIFSRIKEYFDRHKDLRVLVTPGHASPWRMRRHVRDAVPVAVAGKNIMADGTEKFSELAAKTCELKFAKGAELLAFFLAR